MKKFLMISISFFSAGLLFLMLFSEKEESKGFTLKGKSFMEGISISHLKDGNTVWTLTARKADLNRNDTKAKLFDVVVTVQENGMNIYTDRAVYDLSTQDITTKDEIRAETEDYTVTTSIMDYEASSKDITTEGMITIEGKRFKVEGKGMMLDEEQKIKILKDVKATFY